MTRPGDSKGTGARPAGGTRSGDAPVIRPSGPEIRDPRPTQPRATEESRGSPAARAASAHPAVHIRKSVPVRNGARAVRVVLIDNYDSFTYNLAQALQVLGAEVLTVRNDELSPSGVMDLEPTHLVISPGPGGPEDTGITIPLLRLLAGRVPVLGVCLGHQALGYFYGARVTRAPYPVHGKTSPVFHDGRTIYRGLSNPFTATRYHSLVVDPDLPSELEMSARSEDGLVMGIRHRSLPLEGVQFHPESFLTAEGERLLRNFLEMEV